MRSLNEWLSSYGNDHQNVTNQKIHRICVPAIFFTVVGLIHLIPMDFTKYRIGLGDILLTLAMIWYLALSLKAFGLILVHVLAFVGITNWLVQLLGVTGAVWILVGIFVLAWIGQFYGHKLEGRKPSFLTDLQYLLIGPLWVWLGEHKD